MRSSMRIQGCHRLICAIVWLHISLLAQAQTVTNIVNFNGTDGQLPYRTSPVQGRDGRLYGTTYYGGAYGAGTIWAVQTSGSASVFYSFDGVTATTPQSGLIMATDAISTALPDLRAGTCCIE